MELSSILTCRWNWVPSWPAYRTATNTAWLYQMLY